MSAQKVGILDIGTNSVHLFIAGQDSQGNLEHVFTKKYPIRLGEDIAKDNRIRKPTIKRLSAAVDECLSYTDEHDASLHAFATYSLRTADNSQAVIETIERDTGMQIKVLSGLEEAKAIFIGQQSHFDLRSANWMMVDIGGGSTEVIFGSGKGVKETPRYNSLDLGAVTMSLKYDFLQNRHRGVQLLASRIQKVCKKADLPEKTSPQTCFGSSGTIKAIGKLHRHLFKETDSLHGHTLSLRQLWELQNVLMSWNRPEEIAQNTGLSVRRSEVIWAGITILLGIMHYARCNELVISKASVRDGLALNILGN